MSDSGKCRCGHSFFEHISENEVPEEDYPDDLLSPSIFADLGHLCTKGCFICGCNDYLAEESFENKINVYREGIEKIANKGNN